MKNDPAAKIAPSLQIVADLAERGLDLADEYSIEHFFLASAEIASQAADRFIDAGYAVHSISNFEDDSMFGVAINQPVDDAAMIQVIHDACEIGDALGVEYDGWDIDVSDSNLKSSD